MTAPVKAAPPGAKGAQQKVLQRPFKVGVQYTDDLYYDSSVTVSASAQALPIYSVPANGFLTGLYLYVTCTTAGNSANTAYQADGPWTVINQIKFTDGSSNELITTISGHQLYLINKFGGYSFQDDPKASPVYSATTSTGATGGSFAFILRIPVEVVPRDALGALPNKSQSTPYRVEMTVGTTSAIYSTGPTAAGTVRFRIAPINYWEPTSQDGSGNPVANQPPGVGFSQYWTATPYALSAGTISQQLTTSTGFPIRNLIFVLTDSTNTRSGGETDFPDPFQLQLQSNTIVNRLKAIWQHQIAQWYGYSGAVGDSAGSKDNGVYVLPFNVDFYPKPGWENRRQYLRTTDGMRLMANGTIGGSGAHTLTVITNYVSPAPGAALAAVTT